MAANSSPWRFSLRTLFLAVTLLAVCCALVVSLRNLGVLLAFGLCAACILGIGFVRKDRYWLACGIVGLLLFCTVYWCDVSSRGTADGDFELRGQVSVVSDDDESPIAGAGVDVTWNWEPYSFDHTNSLGVVTFSRRFAWGYSFSGFEITKPLPARSDRTVHLDRYQLHVVADGYESVEIPLSEAVNQKRWARDGSMLPPIIVGLKRIEPAQ